MARRPMAELLYATEQEIAELVLGRGHFPEWKALAIILERQGLPTIDAAFGMRYFPKVKQFLDRRNGVTPLGEKPARPFYWTPRRGTGDLPPAPKAKKRPAE